MMTIVLVPVIMACALGGTVGLLKIIKNLRSETISHNTLVPKS